ncbi:hypothetical protein FOZ63_003613, partial [Perkinsus olseni]
MWHANSHDPGGDPKADNDCQQASNSLCGGVKVFCDCNDYNSPELLRYRALDRVCGLGCREPMEPVAVLARGAGGSLCCVSDDVSHILETSARYEVPAWDPKGRPLR